MAIPRQDTTDFSDPKKRFLWAFQGIEYNGTPFAAPPAVFEHWSEHLSKAGFVHVSEIEDYSVRAKLPKQEIHYQPPVRGQDHVLNQSGRWVPVTQQIQEPIVKTVDQMTPQEKAKMLAEFKEAGLID